MLTLREVPASGYRSLKAIRFPVDVSSVFIGANGVGQTNLYRALERLQSAYCLLMVSGEFEDEEA